jgi:hypothetical protein
MSPKGFPTRAGKSSTTGLSVAGGGVGVLRVAMGGSEKRTLGGGFKSAGGGLVKNSLIKTKFDSESGRDFRYL